MIHLAGPSRNVPTGQRVSICENALKARVEAGNPCTKVSIMFPADAPCTRLPIAHAKLTRLARGADATAKFSCKDRAPRQGVYSGSPEVIGSFAAVASAPQVESQGFLSNAKNAGAAAGRSSYVEL